MQGVASVEAVNQTPDRKIVNGSLGLSLGSLEALKAGDLLFIADLQPYLDGYYALLAAYQYVKYGMLPMGQISTGPLILTKDNVDEVLKVNQAISRRAAAPHRPTLAMGCRWAAFTGLRPSQSSSLGVMTLAASYSQDLPGEDGGRRRRQPTELVARRIWCAVRSSSLGGDASCLRLLRGHCRQHGFVTFDGTAGWINTAAELGIIAIPIGILMVAGEFDLSVGAIVGASSIIVAIGTTLFGLPIWPMIGLPCSWASW